MNRDWMSCWTGLRRQGVADCRHGLAGKLLPTVLRLSADAEFVTLVVNRAWLEAESVSCLREVAVQ
jgi:hypothetical protein